MIIIRSAGAMALALLLVACGEKQTAGPEGENASSGPATIAATKVYSGAGTVQSISGDKVTIAHGPIAGIGWPAMTMTFTAPTGIASGVRPGAQVDFSFRQNGSAFVLTSLRPR